MQNSNISAEDCHIRSNAHNSKLACILLHAVVATSCPVSIAHLNAAARRVSCDAGDAHATPDLTRFVSAAHLDAAVRCVPYDPVDAHALPDFLQQVRLAVRRNAVPELAHVLRLSGAAELLGRSRHPPIRSRARILNTRPSVGFSSCGRLQQSR